MSDNAEILDADFVNMLRVMEGKQRAKLEHIREHLELAAEYLDRAAANLQDILG